MSILPPSAGVVLFGWCRQDHSCSAVGGTSPPSLIDLQSWVNLANVLEVVLVGVEETARVAR